MIDMHRFLAVTTLALTIAACSSFGSDSPTPEMGDASTPNNLDGGIDAADATATPPTIEAGTKTQLVQSAAQQNQSNAQTTPFTANFPKPPTVGNTAIVVVGNSGPSATSVSAGGTVLENKGASSDHIASTVWVGKIVASLPSVTVTWAVDGTPVKNPVVFITEWSNVGPFALAKSMSGNAGDPAKTPTLIGNDFSLVLAVGAMQDSPESLQDPNFQEVEGSGTGGAYVYLSLAFTTGSVSPYATTWKTSRGNGWDALILGFR